MRTTALLSLLSAATTTRSSTTATAAFNYNPLSSPVIRHHCNRHISHIFTNGCIKTVSTAPAVASYGKGAPTIITSAKSNDGGDDEHNHNDENHPIIKDSQRRKTLLSAVTAATGANAFPFIGRKNKINANAADVVAVEEGKPIADFLMRRLRLPKGGVGREYIILQLYIQGKGPFDFMVDSGLTTELITPHLQQILNINQSSSGITKKGISAGATQTQTLIELNDVSLCCGTFSDGQSLFPLPGPLHAIVTDFPQEHMDPQHDPVEGMIGMEVLEQFDVDFDFPAGRLRLWKPGTVGKAVRNTMASVDAVVVNETRLLGFRVVPSSALKGSSSTSEIAAQPFLGVVDCGASFSVVNWAAAPLLGLPARPDDDIYKKNPAVAGIGVDGRPQLLPTSRMSLGYCGDPISNNKGGNAMSFSSPPPDWKPWDPISIAVGDLPVFSQLLGDGRTPFRGPAGIIGLDILSQRRVILETSDGRRRRIYVGRQ